MSARAERTQAPPSKRSITTWLGRLAAVAVCSAPLIATVPATAANHPRPEGASANFSAQTPDRDGGLDATSVAVGAASGIALTWLGLGGRRRRDHTPMP
ncbi:hypothetical protein EV649_6591 [Kribbella sp. VKM Ac-2569]|uniref:hypothetical protein n=1 Tax=Kribbella sp. VKM Ac-2569 TaxID=2512220 RepID=UPI00102BDD5B|nr:hypothetical protein [Kribbella sp. VKM Ac-2569]RZT13400.1 hypothetical protein EV649_6591 [Kribbella sp. VKM Ac-2569]